MIRARQHFQRADRPAEIWAMDGRIGGLSRVKIGRNAMAFGIRRDLAYADRVGIMEETTMDTMTIASLVFGALFLGAIALFALERRAVAKRKAARGGREIDVADLIAFGSAAGQGERTHQ